MKKTRNLLVIAGFAPTIASATVLFQDDFSVSGNINGTTPDVTLNSATWLATTPSTNFNSPGATLTARTSVTGTTYLDLGSTYFSANPGTYELSLQIIQPAGSSSTGWVGLGFTSGAVTANSFGTSSTPANGAGYSWLLYRANGAVTGFAGPATTNPWSLANTFTTGVSHTFRLVLNTSSPNWTVNAFVDSTELDLNGGSIAGTSYTYTTSPTALRYVALSTSGTGGPDAIVDNFVLNYTAAIPEPGASAALAGLVVVGFAGFRQSRRLRA